MKTPRFLKKGDVVAIVATARKVDKAALMGGLQVLKAWGLIPIMGSSVGLEHNQFAGTDLQRAADLQRQIDNPEVKAIWCARGGYGTVRILDLVDFSPLQENPKWIVGYSDVTAIHAHLHTIGISSVQGEMPALIKEKSVETVESLRRAWFGEELAYSWSPDRLDRKGRFRGELIGGNLSVLYALLGSVSFPDLKDKILFLEDLDEYLYHIDRMMQNLYRAGKLAHLSGLLIGGMTQMHDNSIAFGKTAYEIIMDTVKEYDFPVGFGFPAGHLKDNRTLIFGAEVKMEIGARQNFLHFL